MYWYEDDVAELERRRAGYTYEPRLACYGSSSIRLWENLHNFFDGYEPINLGFGGSTLEACVFYFDSIFMDLQPEAMLIYAGDNDLGDGKTPEQVLGFWHELSGLMQKRYGNIPVSYISIKPSIARLHLQHKIETTNNLIANHISTVGKHYGFINTYNAMLDNDLHPKPLLYVEDGLHLSQSGYELWEEIVAAYIVANPGQMPEKKLPC